MDLDDTPYTEGCHSPIYRSPPPSPTWDTLDIPYTEGRHSPIHRSPPQRYGQPSPTCDTLDTPTWSPSLLEYRTHTPSPDSTPEKYGRVLGDPADASATSDWAHPPSSINLAFTTATTQSNPSNSRERSGKSLSSNHFVSAGVLFDSSTNGKSTTRQMVANEGSAGDVTCRVCTRFYRFII